MGYHPTCPSWPHRVYHVTVWGTTQPAPLGLTGSITWQYGVPPNQPLLASQGLSRDSMGYHPTCPSWPHRVYHVTVWGTTQPATLGLTGSITWQYGVPPNLPLLASQGLSRDIMGYHPTCPSWPHRVYHVTLWGTTQPAPLGLTGSITWQYGVPPNLPLLASQGRSRDSMGYHPTSHSWPHRVYHVTVWGTTQPATLGLTGSITWQYGVPPNLRLLVWRGLFCVCWDRTLFFLRRLFMKNTQAPRGTLCLKLTRI